MDRFRFGDYTAADVEHLAQEFREARPFPHLVLDDVIAADPDAVLAAFPDDDWPHWRRFTDAYQAGKTFCSDIDLIPQPLVAMIQELSAPPFLEFLECVAGIESLIPDPHLEGGGLHSSGAGGVLAPHTDFHVYRRLQLYRRINVLVYLNPGWTEGDGGLLELYTKGASVPDRNVVPAWGRCVIFATDDRSVHGFSRPVTHDARRRRSIALYYYTSSEAPSFSGDTNTYWQASGRLYGASRVRYRAYQGVMTAVRGLSFLAHRLDPNLSARRDRQER